MRIVLIGVGNPERGDDAAGPEAALMLAHRAPSAVEVRVAAGDPAEILDALEGSDAAILVDALEPRGVPGRIARLDASHEPLPAERFATSTHGLGVAHAIELARSLGRLPPRVVVYGLEARGFGFGEELSPPVRGALEEIVRRVLAEVEALPAEADA